MAMSGLIVLGFSLYYPAKQLHELHREQVQLEGEISVLELQWASESPESPESPPSLEFKIKLEQFNTKNKLHGVALNQMRTFMYLRAAGIIVGGLMAGLGFVLWYSKIQKYQDLILLRDATPAKPEMLENPPSSKDKPDDVQK